MSGFPWRNDHFPSINGTMCLVPSQYQVSVMQPHGGYIADIPGVSRNQRVLASSQSKEETTEIPSPLINSSSSCNRAPQSSPLTAYMPDNTFLTVAEVI